MVREAVLTITDNTTTSMGVVATANIVVPTYGTFALTGFVGDGRRPQFVLTSSGADGGMVIRGTVVYKLGEVYKLSGKVDGFGNHSQGALGDDPVGSAATWSTADQHDGSVSALLTQDGEGSTYVQFAAPEGITVSDLATIDPTEWGLWHNLEVATGWGPQVELRFLHPYNINPDGAGHVDITLLPYQITGTGEWVESTLSTTTNCGYYGNDPWDSTAYSDFSGTIPVSAVEAAIDAEAAMIANGPFSCSDWVLSRVRIEIWEAEARTCYVDDVTIDGEEFSFEPVWFYGSFKAIIVPD